MAYERRKPNKEYIVPVKINRLSKYEYDMKSVVELLMRGNFGEYSISISMPVSYILPPKEDGKKARGSRSIGHIVSYDGLKNEAVISISPKYVDIADKMTNLVLTPSIRFDKNGKAKYCTYFFVQEDNDPVDEEE